MSPIDRLNEPRFTVNEVASKCGVRPETVYRWKREGVRGHKPRFFMLGARQYYITASDLNNFLVVTSGMRDDEPATTHRTEAQREKAIAAADGKAASCGY